MGNQIKLPLSDIEKADHIIGVLLKNVKSSKSLMKEVIKLIDGQYTPQDKVKLKARVEKLLQKIEKEQPQL